MNTEWKQLSGIEEVTAARDAGMEIEVDILDEWVPWHGEYGALVDRLKFRARQLNHLRYRIRQPNPTNVKTEAQTGENEVSEWHELNGIEEVAAAVAEGMEIEIRHGDVYQWEPWPGLIWYSTSQYRARHPAPAKVLVKRICWTSTGGNLTWTKEDYQFYSKDWKRFPAGDTEGEVDV
jgi:hypothetical protein